MRVVMAFAAVLMAGVLGAQEAKGVRAIDMHTSPSCGCCEKWADYMRANGFEVKTIKSENFIAIKEQYKIPDKFMSCHTGVIDGYAIEGHIPFEEVEKLLRDKPKDVIGIAVPGMPQGSPGMEQGRPDDVYDVVMLMKNGDSKVIATYKGKTKIK